MSTKNRKNVSSASLRDIRSLRRAVTEHFALHKRDLPWRRTRDPYKIMVSEVMLQQTQVSRVLEKYKEFLAAFPNVRALADARLADVLRAWSGLGYNRRAKYLHEAAKRVLREHGGKMPKTAEELERLPGIGKYTARAICAFAYNTPAVFIETNIRTVFIHHFFPTPNPQINRGRGLSVGARVAAGAVSDRELLPLIEQAAKGQEPRQWYAALMDYGSYLKQTEGNASRRSAHHVVQKKFKGSAREARGKVLKALQKGALTRSDLVTQTGLRDERVDLALFGLQKDGLVRKLRTHWALA